MSKPSTVTCPKCTAVAHDHCKAAACNLFRCARCRSYGPYQNLTAESWADYHLALPLELLYEMAPLPDEQYNPPRPVLPTILHPDSGEGEGV